MSSGWHWYCKLKEIETGIVWWGVTHDPPHWFFHIKSTGPGQSRSPSNPMMVDLGRFLNIVGIMVLHVGVHRIDGRSTNDTPRPSLLEAQKGALGNEKMLCWLQNWMYILDSTQLHDIKRKVSYVRELDYGFIFSRWSWNRFSPYQIWKL